MKPITAYYCFSAFFCLSIAMTFVGYARFIFSIGLTPSDFALINAFFWGTTAILEIPTGLLADTRGRAWSMRMAMMCYILGAGMYWFAEDLGMAIIAESLFGIGTAFLSGADEAWITDAIIKSGREHELRSIFGTAAIIRSVCFLVGGLLGGFIAAQSIGMIWIACGAGIMCAWFIAIKYIDGTGEPVERISERLAFVRSLKLIRNSRDLRWITLFMVSIGLVTPMNLYWAPFFEDRTGAAGLSGLWIVIHMPLALSGWVIRRPGCTPKKEVPWLTVSLFLTAIGMVFMAVVESMVFAIVFIVLHELGRGLIGPLSSTFTQGRVESSYRATYGSLQSLVGRFGFFVVLVVIAVASHGQEPSRQLMGDLMVWCGVGLGAAAVVLWLLRPQVSRE